MDEKNQRALKRTQFLNYSLVIFLLTILLLIIFPVNNQRQTWLQETRQAPPTLLLQTQEQRVTEVAYLLTSTQNAENATATLYSNKTETALAIQTQFQGETRTATVEIGLALANETSAAQFTATKSVEQTATQNMYNTEQAMAASETAIIVAVTQTARVIQLTQTYDVLQQTLERMQITDTPSPTATFTDTPRPTFTYTEIPSATPSFTPSYTPSAVPTEIPVICYVNIESGTLLQVAPADTSRSITVLSPADTVGVLGRLADQSWYLVEYRAVSAQPQRGWVKEEALRLVDCTVRIYTLENFRAEPVILLETFSNANNGWNPVYINTSDGVIILSNDSPIIDPPRGLPELQIPANFRIETVLSLEAGATNARTGLRFNIQDASDGVGTIYYNLAVGPTGLSENNNCQISLDLVNGSNVSAILDSRFTCDIQKPVFVVVEKINREFFVTVNGVEVIGETPMELSGGTISVYLIPSTNEQRKTSIAIFYQLFIWALP